MVILQAAHLANVGQPEEITRAIFGYLGPVVEVRRSG